MLHSDENEQVFLASGNENEMPETKTIEAMNKKNVFKIVPSILRKKYFQYKYNCSNVMARKRYSLDENDINHNEDDEEREKQMTPFPITDACLIPGSPISPRVKNFNHEMLVLVLSRKDNPYLSQQLLQQHQTTNSFSSSPDQDSMSLTSAATPILARRRPRGSVGCSGGGGSSGSRNHSFHFRNSSFISNRNAHNVSNLSLDPSTMTDDRTNLHDKLIRSPPPNFPEKLGHFLFNENLFSDDDPFED